MEYVLLLNAYRGSEAAGQYSVTFGGSIGDCRAQTHHDGQTYPVAMNNYSEKTSEFKSLLDQDSVSYPGRIVGLAPHLSAVATPLSRKGKARRKGKPKISRKIKRAGRGETT